MVERVWEDLLSEQDEEVIKKAGYEEAGASSWESRGLGDNPMVLVIDMQRKSVGRNVPITEAVEDYRTAMGEIAYEAIEHIQALLDHAREQDVPVGYTKGVSPKYDDPDNPDLAIVEEVAPEPGETVVQKSYASAFYGTDLTSRLIRNDIDTLIPVGNSTSGCVRASVIDAQERGFDIVVPRECTFDRIQASHKIALMDMWMKYAEVLDRADVEEYIEGV